MANYQYLEVYSDLSYNPQLNQLGDATKLTNMDSIKQSVKTIVLTRPGSRLFEPDFGCGVGNYLFELIDTDTADALKKLITNALGKYEPRITVSDVVVNVNNDANSMDVEITYLIQEIQEYDTTKINLSKL